MVNIRIHILFKLLENLTELKIVLGTITETETFVCWKILYI